MARKLPAHYKARYRQRSGLVSVRTYHSEALERDTGFNLAGWTEMKLTDRIREFVQETEKYHHITGLSYRHIPEYDGRYNMHPHIKDGRAAICVKRVYQIAFTKPGKAQIGDEVLDSAFPGRYPDSIDTLHYADGREFYRLGYGGWIRGK